MAIMALQMSEWYLLPVHHPIYSYTDPVSGEDLIITG